MFKKLLFLVLVVFVSDELCSKTIEIVNTIKKTEDNNYHITTKIISQEYPGIMRLTLSIPDEYSIKVYNDTNILIDSRGQVLKFYADFDGFNTLEINYQLTKKSNDESEASITAHVEFNVNGEIVVIDKDIILSENDFVSNAEMDSISTYYSNKSNAASNNILAGNQLQELISSKTNDTKKIKESEDLVSMPTGYNSATNSGLKSAKKYYSVQILSLQYFNENRFLDFLASYKIKLSDTYKKEINGAVKIYIGKYNNYEEAKQLKEKLVNQNNLTDSFIVSY